MKKKSKLINWDKVAYTVKPYDMNRYVLNLDIREEDIEEYVKKYQTKAWELYFVLSYFLVIYTTFIVGLPVFITFGDTIFWFFPMIGILMTVFFMGENLLKAFTKWIRIPVSLYLLFLFIYLILSITG